MGETRRFTPVKLICGLIAIAEAEFSVAEQYLSELYGKIDSRSALFAFDQTEYYCGEMGAPLYRRFISFERLVNPDRLGGIKLETNRIENRIRREAGADGRRVNIDPGNLRASSLVMATVKDFAHRIPLRDGIYAHLELLFGKEEVKVLPWTYPDFFSSNYQAYFLKVRRRYLEQMRSPVAG